MAKLADISKRTLRYYDDIGLLKPSHINKSGYRYYDEKQVDDLQQILMYKKLGFDLKQIKAMLFNAHFDHIKALETHLSSLEKELKHTQTLIQTIKKTIAYQKGETIMTDKEKFEGLKAKILQEHETKYGKEAREKYSDEVVDMSNAKFMAQTESAYEEINQLGEKILTTLKEALKQHDPSSDIAQQVCQMHQTWIEYYWPTYDKLAHLALVNMYLEDERFKAYYEKVGEGATKLLVDAMTIYLR